MGAYFSMQFGKWAACFLGLAGALCICRHTSYHKPVQFDSVWELKKLAISRNLVFHCGNGHGIVYRNFFLADHPIGLDDLLPVSHRRDCGLTPAWRGILWAVQINDPSTTVTLIPELTGGKWRVWGDVLVAGDEELMDRIEEIYRSAPS